jgi:hypothetical protein
MPVAQLQDKAQKSPLNFFPLDRKTGSFGGLYNEMPELRMTSLVGTPYRISRTADRYTYYKKITTLMNW